jgi:hypothetical protein
MRLVPLLSSVLLATPAATVASQAYPSPPEPPWGIGFESLSQVAVPEDIWALVAPELEYGRGELVEGIVVDLNHDGTSDYLLQSSSRLCGTGGCSYLAIDGARRSRIGTSLTGRATGSRANEP